MEETNFDLDAIRYNLDILQKEQKYNFLAKTMKVGGSNSKSLAIVIPTNIVKAMNLQRAEYVRIKIER